MDMTTTMDTITVITMTMTAIMIIEAIKTRNFVEEVSELNE